jgi:signal transduction histidine kinase
MQMNQELARQALVVAGQVLEELRIGEEGKDALTTIRLDTIRVDSVGARIQRVVQPTPRLRQLLERFGGYFLVLDPENRVLFSSFAIRQLTDESQDSLLKYGIELQPGGRAAVVPLTRDTLIRGRLLIASAASPNVGRNISRVVAGLPTSTAELAPGLLFGTLLALTPLVLIFSLGVGYVVAGRAFRPIDDLINELEAITDGRSLHRRLALDAFSDELSRLAGTVNAMIGRLESSFAGLRRFTADASHELKTPLTVLRADVERAMSPRTSPSERLEALEEALQETARMADLVDSLLTLARADEGRFDLYREPIHLEPLVHEVFETAQILGEQAELTVALALVEDAVVLGDRTRLRQLFLNLVTNAIKYTPRGGRVDLGLKIRSEHEVAFAVRDTGIGISAGDLPHIFDRFWRADRARSRASERGGFGLGLAISQWIAQAHGGTLTAESRLGRGSVFIVSLPIATPQRVAMEEEEQARAIASDRPAP